MRRDQIIETLLSFKNSMESKSVLPDLRRALRGSDGSKKDPPNFGMIAELAIERQKFDDNQVKFLSDLGVFDIYNPNFWQEMYYSNPSQDPHEVYSAIFNIVKNAESLVKAFQFSDIDVRKVMRGGAQTEGKLAIILPSGSIDLTISS